MPQPDTTSVAANRVIDSALDLATSDTRAHIRERAILIVQVEQLQQLNQTLNARVAALDAENIRLNEMVAQSGETVLQGEVAPPTET